MVNHPNRRTAAKSKVAATVEPTHDHEHDYTDLLKAVRASFGGTIPNESTVFMTDVEGLNALYLDLLPSERQAHTCFACKRFIGTYGKLVAIGPDGDTFPLMWNPVDVPDFYRPAFSAMYDATKKARVTGPFLSRDLTWGQPVTGKWQHMAVSPPGAVLYNGIALSPAQAMAAVRENFRTVATALSEFTVPLLDQALRLLEHDDVLARAEKFIGPVKWLRALHDRPKGRAGENVLWRAVATAPEGFCHPKASVVAPLLDSIAAGLPFETIKAKFDAMLHPLRYQRPQAPPSAGNIKAAEALVEKLGIARSLERRFARLDEIKTVWNPAPLHDAPSDGGVFGHLKAKSDAPPPVTLPVLTMTWAKFTGTVLPNAERMELMVPAHGNFEAFVTALHDDAPLIFKWGNPVSSYVYHAGSLAQQWGLQGNAWVRVLALAAYPATWDGSDKSYLDKGVLFVLEGARDSKTDQGNALFPETLRSELHGVRATIEAYSKSAVIAVPDGQLASGYGLGKQNAKCHLRAFVNGGWNRYTIDRWD